MHIMINPIIVNGSKLRPERTISAVINDADDVTALITSDLKFLRLMNSLIKSSFFLIN